MLWTPLRFDDGYSTTFVFTALRPPVPKIYFHYCNETLYHAIYQDTIVLPCLAVGIMAFFPGLQS